MWLRARAASAVRGWCTAGCRHGGSGTEFVGALGATSPRTDAEGVSVRPSATCRRNGCGAPARCGRCGRRLCRALACQPHAGAVDRGRRTAGGAALSGHALALARRASAGGGRDGRDGACSASAGGRAGMGRPAKCEKRWPVGRARGTHAAVADGVVAGADGASGAAGAAAAVAPACTAIGAAVVSVGGGRLDIAVVAAIRNTSRADAQRHGIALFVHSVLAGQAARPAQGGARAAAARLRTIARRHRRRCGRPGTLSAGRVSFAGAGVSTRAAGTSVAAVSSDGRRVRAGVAGAPGGCRGCGVRGACERAAVAARAAGDGMRAPGPASGCGDIAPSVCPYRTADGHAGSAVSGAGLVDAYRVCVAQPGVSAIAAGRLAAPTVDDGVLADGEWHQR
eukprot:ctg_193.g95